MYAEVFTDMAIAVVFIYAIWLFHQFIHKTIAIIAIKEKYLALYELKVLEGEIKERNLSFEQLDDFEKKFVPNKKQTRINTIDEGHDLEPGSKEKEKRK